MEPILSVRLPDGKLFEIHIDEDPEDPRTWDNFGTMVCWHRRYSLGDRHDFQTPDDFMEWWEENGKDGVLLPLYLYDHSGITMSTSSFSCPWDSGQVGYIYATADRIMKEFGPPEPLLCRIANRPSTEMLEKAKRLLKSEVETYDMYIRGDVYGFTIKDENGTYSDSCWGYYGDIKESGILDELTPEGREAVLAEL